MSRHNTSVRYGGVAKTFHWLTALFILTALALGFIAYEWPYENSAQLAVKANLFSLHKTIGLTAFLVAVLRILWALQETRPKLLNGDHWLEATAAETVHWMLYGAMVLVPLTGWIHHAATTGFAPIWWPFGQSLPFVPKDPTFAATFGALHYVAMLMLILSLLAHIGGALKHAIIDRDKTLQRMLPGTSELPEPPAKQPGHLLPVFGAVSVWLATLYIGAFSGLFVHEADEKQVAQLAEVTSDWQVDSGTLGISVQQFGAAVDGTFADWTADIAFDETPTDGKHGNVVVTIAIGSLTLGSVTDQALGADYLNAANFPTAVFTADIIGTESGYVAEGVLALNGHEVPTALPFDLMIEDNTATMNGSLALDRRTFHVGDDMTDESSLGFGVAVNVALTATRAE